MNRAYATSRVLEVRKHPDSTLTRHEVQLALPVEEQVGNVLRYKLRFPWLPPSKNVYDGWAPQWQNAAKQKWCKRIAEECESLNVPKRQARIGLAALLVFSTNRRRDPQNYAQTLWNFIPDGLQRCGVLLDDRADAIDWAGGRLGVSFKIDTKPGVPKAKIERTVIGLTVLLP